MLFIMLPFDMLFTPAKAFLKHALGDMTAAKIMKAHVCLAMAAVCGTVRLS
jgi:hypothetical protein